MISHLELMNVWAFGHSWQGSNSNATANARYFERFASRHRMGTITNNGISGRTIGDIAMANLGGTFAWTVGTKALILSACYINDITLLGDSLAAQQGFQHALRSCLSRWTSIAIKAANTAAFVYMGSGWTTPSVPLITSTPPAASAVGSTGGAQWTTTTVGDSFSVLVPGDSADLIFIARAAGAGLYTAKLASTTVGTLDLTLPTGQDTPAVMKLRGLGAGNHTVTVTLTSGTSMTIDSMNMPHPTPTLGAIIAEGDCVGGTLPSGATDLTYTVAQALYRKLQAAVVAEYPSFIWVDLQANGWNPATMVTSDGKHPHDAGCAFIADILDQKLATASSFNQSLNVLNTANDPVVPSFSAVTIPFGGVDGTGNDPNAPTNLNTGAVTGTSVALSWTAPSSGITVTDYAVQYRIVGNVSWTTFAHGASSATSNTVTGLDTVTNPLYEFRVAAVTASGTGNFTPATSMPAIKSGYASRYNGTNVVGSAGTVVTTWTDLTAAVNFTGTNGPTIRDAVTPAAFRYLEFDASNDTLSRNVTAMPYTIMVVCRVRTITGGVSSIMMAGNGASDRVVGVSSGGAFIANDGAALGSRTADQNWHVVGITFNGATSAIQVDNQADETGNAGTNNTATLLRLAESSGGLFYPIDFAEIIIYSTPLSASERRSTAAALKATYGI